MHLRDGRVCELLCSGATEYSSQTLGGLIKRKFQLTFGFTIKFLCAFYIVCWHCKEVVKCVYGKRGG